MRESATVGSPLRDFSLRSRSWHLGEVNGSSSVHVCITPHFDCPSPHLGHNPLRSTWTSPLRPPHHRPSPQPQPSPPPRQYPPPPPGHNPHLGEAQCQGHNPLPGPYPQGHNPLPTGATPPHGEQPHPTPITPLPLGQNPHPTKCSRPRRKWRATIESPLPGLLVCQLGLSPLSIEAKFRSI